MESLQTVYGDSWKGGGAAVAADLSPNKRKPKDDPPPKEGKKVKPSDKVKIKPDPALSDSNKPGGKAVNVTDTQKTVTITWPAREFKGETRKAETVEFDIAAICAETGVNRASICAPVVILFAQASTTRSNDENVKMALQYCKHWGNPGHENATTPLHTCPPAITGEVVRRHKKTL